MSNWNVGDAAIDRAREFNSGWSAAPTAPSIIPALPRGHDYASQLSADHPRIPRCPELDCVRDLLTPSAIAFAELRAAETGVGADRALIAAGMIAEETYVSALARSLGIKFDPLSGRARDDCPLSDRQLLEAATTGLLPLADGETVNIAVVPCLVDSRRLVAVARSGSSIGQRIRLTSAGHLREFVIRHAAHEIEYRAINELRVEQPEHSAAIRPRFAGASAVAALAVAAFVAAPGAAMLALEIMLGLIFLAWTGLRLLGLLSEHLARRERHEITDDGLPIYSVVIALYREAAAAEALVKSLRDLNYPGIMAQTPQTIWRDP